MSQITFTIDIKYNTEALNQLESQLEHIAELMDRIHGQQHDTDKALSVGEGVKIAINSAVIESALINSTTIDDHTRQIVREELDKELLPGGKLYHASLYRGAW
ncbi:hypothetical protein [Xenorhabdus kozodoii]|nr:hypothetical protein [Xenorhabdus kozodoii]